MLLHNHATFRGHVYRRATGSTQTFEPFSTPQTYVDSWMKNPNYIRVFADYEMRLKKMLSTTRNCISEEIIFEYDLVEVCNFCLLWRLLILFKYLMHTMQLHSTDSVSLGKEW